MIEGQEGWAFCVVRGAGWIGVVSEDLPSLRRFLRLQWATRPIFKGGPNFRDGALMSARSQQQCSAISWLAAGLLGIALVGCQSTALRDAGHSSTAKRGPIHQVSNEVRLTSAAKEPEAWQLQKTQREEAVRRVAVESKSKEFVTRVSFESELWKSDELTPLVTSEPGLSSRSPFTDREIEWPSHCKELCFRCDLDNALPTLWCDAKEVVNWNSGLFLAGAGSLAIWFREGDIDREVRESVAESPLRWGEGSRVLGKIGDVEYQAPIMLGIYGYSLWSQNEELHDLMGTMLSASVITGVSASALKLITNTDRPSDNWMNGHYGFPSYHTASTFAIAAVLDEYYGCKVGLPAYLLAGAVGFSRIDEQDHDLSDVVFGAALGFVIGKSVAGQHLCGNSKIQFMPYFHPTDGSPGVGGEVTF